MAYHASVYILLLAAISHVMISASEHPTVYIIRHGEKPLDSTDSGLSAEGIERAQCIRDIFGANSIYNIGHIMAPKVNSRGEHRRSYETVLPLATDLKLSVDTSCKRNRVHCVGKKVRNYEGSGNILISWRHGKMKQIVKDLGYEDPPEYPEDR
ncbi:putative phosphoglycerate mutase family protein [Aspergillus tanneri]|uniref:Phosphoglycerate mutase family protein n=1 Tax=Aspergillus tanneri TaxID=1220188 RepID=A0A5M9MHF4_9EURO|nr:uncharacterized protein ATNIH1004_008961 [Aspergillus tanneri]KAA8644754.1 hypothetical protein ATNIH1004_008961 [Aspergillus tanneri]